jgi:hypothetical protein
MNILQSDLLGKKSKYFQNKTFLTSFFHKSFNLLETQIRSTLLPFTQQQFRAEKENFFFFRKKS